MKIDLTLKIGEEKFDVNLAFDILSCIAPSNLWILADLGIGKEGLVTVHTFKYRKVVSLMEVRTFFKGIEYHGQVISIANGDQGIMNLVINLNEGNSPIEWEQIDNDFLGDNTYFIDLDELRQSKGYAELTVDECFSKLLSNKEIEYHLRGDRFVELPSGNIKNASEISVQTE